MGILMTEGGGNWGRKGGNMVKAAPGWAPRPPGAPKGTQNFQRWVHNEEEEEALPSSSQVNSQPFCPGKGLQQGVPWVSDALPPYDGCHTLSCGILALFPKDFIFATIFQLSGHFEHPLEPPASPQASLKAPQSARPSHTEKPLHESDLHPKPTDLEASVGPSPPQPVQDAPTIHGSPPPTPHPPLHRCCYLLCCLFSSSSCHPPSSSPSRG